MPAVPWKEAFLLLNSKYKGIFYIITAAFFFALMSLFVRLAGDLPSVQKSFFRNLVAVAAAAVVLARSRPALYLNRGDWGYLFCGPLSAPWACCAIFTPSTISFWPTPPC